ncbi:YdcF family protein [Microcoleus sp. FACHB-672]|uniref:YdcF family protein n=1 Tax=Microcoleus sp. FACHB-672 TaxID=2692825 RepID=UPI001683054B|nr:ElyC/SanA/YdcF family protein [Microcoleus sp. FACHB-672]MBD2040643.1 YdcF family protein [Microcoleus sp. FACHB-672]
MFSLLTQALLWLLLLTFLWYILQRVVPKNYLAVLGYAVLLLALIMPFFYPADPLSGSAWSILSLPLKPLSLSLLLLLLGTSDVWAGGLKDGKKVVKPNLVIWALVILLLSSNPWISRYLERQVISAGVQPAQVCQTTTTTQIAGTIVVLGRGVTEAYQPAGTQIPQIDTNERIMEAVEQQQQQVSLGNRPLTIVSAGKLVVGTRNQTETEYIETRLANMNVSPITEYSSVSVHDTAVNLKRVSNNQGNVNNRVIVVASAIDVGRAQLTFQKQGVTTIPRASNLQEIICDQRQRRLALADFIPSVEALLRSTRAINEFFALLYYFMRGWLTLS